MSMIYQGEKDGNTRQDCSGKSDHEPSPTLLQRGVLDRRIDQFLYRLITVGNVFRIPVQGTLSWHHPKKTMAKKDHD